MNKAIRLRPYKGKGKRTHRKKKSNPKQTVLNLEPKKDSRLNPVWS